jgi:hypothetical protein
VGRRLYGGAALQEQSSTVSETARIDSPPQKPQALKRQGVHLQVFQTLVQHLPEEAVQEGESQRPDPGCERRDEGSPPADCLPGPPQPQNRKRTDFGLLEVQEPVAAGAQQFNRPQLLHSGQVPDHFSQHNRPEEGLFPLPFFERQWPRGRIRGNQTLIILLFMLE